MILLSRAGDQFDVSKSDFFGPSVELKRSGIERNIHVIFGRDFQFSARRMEKPVHIEHEILVGRDVLDWDRPEKGTFSMIEARNPQTRKVTEVIRSDFTGLGFAYIIRLPSHEPAKNLS